MFSCQKCSKVYAYKCSLNKHIKAHHMPDPQYKCSKCDSSYTYISSLTRHLKDCQLHKKEDSDSLKKTPKSIKISDILRNSSLEHSEECHQKENLGSTNEQLTSLNSYIYRSSLKDKCSQEEEDSDLQNMQSVVEGADTCRSSPLRQVGGTSPSEKEDSNQKCLKFKSLAEFKEWKYEMENTTVSRFVYNRKTNSVKGHSLQHYYCSRNGTYKPKGVLKRSLKIKGTSKIGKNICPAKVCVKILKTGEVYVKFYPTHKGHDNEIQHLYLRSRDKDMVIDKITSGLSYETIIQQLRPLPQFAALQRKDLINIKTSFCLSNTSYPTKCSSVSEWVVEAGEVVRYVKLPGQPCKFGLNEEDTLLVIATKEQLEIGKKYCKKGDVVQIDSTHGMYENSNHLSVIMVVDNYGEAFPAMFCYSNKVDVSSMEIFFRIFQRCLGACLWDVVLVTPGSHFFHKAWEMVNGKDCKHFFSSWHVQQDWKKTLQNKVNGNVLRQNVLDLLVTVCEQTLEETFKKRYKELVHEMLSDHKTQSFGVYLVTHYSKVVEKWAWAYRKRHHLGDKHLAECSQQMLKSVMVKGKAVRGLETSIRCLMINIEYKIKIYRVRQTQEVVTPILSAIIERHEKSESMEKMMWMEIDGSILLNDGDTVVRKAGPCSREDCRVRCSVCNICMHEYICSCHDYAANMTICQHIHYVFRKLYRGNDVEVANEEVMLVDENITEENDAGVGNMAEKKEGEDGNITEKKNAGDGDITEEKDGGDENMTEEKNGGGGIITEAKNAGVGNMTQEKDAWIGNMTEEKDAGDGDITEEKNAGDEMFKVWDKVFETTARLDNPEVYDYVTNVLTNVLKYINSEKYSQPTTSSQNTLTENNDKSAENETNCKNKGQKLYLKEEVDMSEGGVQSDNKQDHAYSKIVSSSQPKDPAPTMVLPSLPHHLPQQVYNLQANELIFFGAFRLVQNTTNS